MQISVLSVLVFLLGFVNASRKLSAHAIVPCENTSGVTAKEFNIIYDHSDHVVRYNVSVNVAFSAYVYADIDVYIYGLKAISTTLDPCTENSDIPQLCNIQAGSIDIRSNSLLGHNIYSELPGVAFTVPDIDAYVIARVRDRTTRQLLSCLYAPIQNTKTVEQTAVKWVTAVLSGIGLLISCIFMFAGTSVEAMNISAVTTLMLSYFQSQAFLDMEAVQRLPPIASAWNENIVWSVGLVYIEFMQKIFRWYVQSTGGSPATYFRYPTVPVLTQKLRKKSVDVISNVTPKVQDWMNSAKNGLFTVEGEDLLNVGHDLAKRDSGAFSSLNADNLVLYRGIKRTGYAMHIEVTSIVLTSFTIFIFICVCVVFIFACLWLIMKLATKNKRKAMLIDEKHDLANPDDSGDYTYDGNRTRSVFIYELIPSMTKGTLLHLWYVAFPPVFCFAFWEWIQYDSAAVIVVSVIMFVVCLFLLLFNYLRLFMIARRSTLQSGTPAYLLYSDNNILERYGYLYSMFNSKYYFFGAVYVAYNFIKVCFIGFAQSSGKTQGLALFVLELFMFITVCVTRPFLSKAVNGIQITTHVIITLNAMFFLFFCNLMTQPQIVNGVMGVIYFILNAAYSLVLLLYIIIYSIMCLIWRRQKKSKRAHTMTDNRESFIYDPEGNGPNSAVEELQALGKASEADHVAEAETPSWFQRNDTHERLNPFEPQMAPPTPQFRGERYTNSIASPKSFTMTSDTSARDIPVLNELNGRHISRESQTSIGLMNNGRNQ